jgi:hypothetical protein
MCVCECVRARARICACVCLEKSKHGHCIMRKRTYFMIQEVIESKIERAFISSITITLVKSWVWPLALHFMSRPPKKTLVGAMVPTGTAMGTTVVICGVCTSILEERTASVCHLSDSHAVVMLKITVWILYSGAPGQVMADSIVDLKIGGLFIADWQCVHWWFRYSWLTVWKLVA